MKLPQAQVVVVAVAALLVMLTWPRQAEGMETKKGTKVKAAAEDVTPVAKPVLPADIREKGVSADLIAKIQKFMVYRMKSLANANETNGTSLYDPRFDYATNPNPKRGIQTRVPANSEEKMKLGYIRYVATGLMTRLTELYPRDYRVARLRKNWAQTLACIDTSGRQGSMVPPGNSGNGDAVLCVNIEYNIAKNFNIIVHEMAHAALTPPTEAEKSTFYDKAHGQAHTDTWKLFTETGISLGWPFIEIAYPNTCIKYNICDPYNEIRGARGVLYPVDGAKKVHGATYLHGK